LLELERSPLSASVAPIAPAPQASRVFHTLDALRGVAATGVVALHFKTYFTPLQFPSGYLAVDLLFIMSGVVIAHSYDRRFRHGMSAWHFMRARLIRLYPLYALGTVLGLAATSASLLGNNSDGWDVTALLIATACAVFFMPDLYGRPNDRLFPLNTPCWSLFFELLVNVAFGVLWKWLSPRCLGISCALCGIGVLVAIVVCGDIDQGYTAAGFFPGLLRTVFGFSLGVLIARRVGTAPRVSSAPLFLAICAVVVVAMGGAPGGTARVIWDAVCVLVVFPAVVIASTLVDPPSWLRGPAAFLGVTSYAIYVLHASVSQIANLGLRHLLDGDPSQGAPYTGIGLLVALLFACWLVDRYYDFPVRRALTRRFSEERVK